MTFIALLTVPVVLHLRSDAPVDIDEHGNPQYRWTDRETTGFIGQQSASETGEESVASEGFRLFLPADAPLDGWDRVTVAGTGYEVIGPPWHVYRGIDGTVHHVEADIRRTV